MTGVWGRGSNNWNLLPATGFPLESVLHDLVAEAPHLLPLAGQPQLTVVGREVRIAGYRADLVAVEDSGRLAIIETKLAANPEARQAVVAQVLTYAAYLHGMSVDELERDVLASHLQERNFTSLADAARANDQDGSYDAETFDAGLNESLRTGSFRLVLVLDKAPDQLAQLIGYLEAVANNRLVLDLITVSSFDVTDLSSILVPQRIEPEFRSRAQESSSPSPKKRGMLAEGADDFEAGIDTSPREWQEDLRRLCSWAKSLESEGLVRLQTYHTKDDRMTLLPRGKDGSGGLVTIWNDKGASLQFWRGNIERRAPHALPAIEEAAPIEIGDGRTIREFSTELLDALRTAYREASL